MNRWIRLAARLAVIGLALAIAAPVPLASAAGCRSLSTAAGAGAEIARLQRQIRANQAFAVKYDCGNNRASFACREIFGRVARAENRVASLTPVMPVRCDMPAAEQPPVRRTTVAAKAMPRTPAKIETMCVRPSDGYYFPTPNSGYSTARDIAKIVAQCRLICDDAEMDVYRMIGQDRDTNAMTSLTTGKPYAALSTAGGYRTAAASRSCDMRRFYKFVLETTPATSGESKTGAAEPAVLMAMNTPLFGNVGLRGGQTFVAAPPRKVRMVGAAFLPAND